MNRFGKDSRWIIPLSRRRKRKKTENKVRYVVMNVYCPNGCSLMDNQNNINGYPGIRIKYKRPGMDGEFVISAIEGDFSKTILSGILEEGVKDELYCPHCNTIFKKLVNCDCSSDGDMVVLGLTKTLDYNNAITFCNVTGCTRGSFIKSGDVIRHVRLRAT